MYKLAAVVYRSERHFITRLSDKTNYYSQDGMFKQGAAVKDHKGGFPFYFGDSENLNTLNMLFYVMC